MPTYATILLLNPLIDLVNKYGSEYAKMKKAQGISVSVTINLTL